MNIYFSDYFNVSSEILESYGALDVSLVNDLPLFIDPFLLFANKKYKKLHDKIIDYLKFLREQSNQGKVTEGLLKAWYMFPEVKQLWLGYSLNGNKGRGLGRNFALAMDQNLNVVFTNFGEEKIAKGSHLEKICLIESGVGRDNISDFTANLIKEYLLEYTQTFAQKYIKQDLRRIVSVSKVSFDYSLNVWKPKQYDLPYIYSDYVLLTPRDMLTKDENWINRSDLIKNVEKISESVPNDQIRAQLNQYLSQRLFKDQKKKELSRKEKQKIFTDALKKYPQLIEAYIRSKEDRGNQAVRLSNQSVSDSENFYIQKVRDFVSQLLSMTDFYNHGIDTFCEARKRILFLKDVIENNDGYKLLYRNAIPICKESDLQILFKFVWLASPSDFNSEVNNGRGPVDFKISRGSRDKTLVEFKLAKNSKLKQNLQNQVKIYEKANKTERSLKVIFYFSLQEKEKVEAILKDLAMAEDDSIILVDARNDNKPSASNVKEAV